MKALMRIVPQLLVLMVLAAGCETRHPVKSVGREEAEQIALQEFPGGFITGGAAEMDLGRLVYKIFLQTATEARRVTVDAATGRVIETRDVTDRLMEEISQEENVPEPVSLSHRDAAEFAALQVAQGEVRKWRVFRDNGRLVYRFNVTSGGAAEKRVTIDARSQAVLELEEVETRN